VLEGSRLIIKMCGIGDAASAQVAIDAGADALGFILAPSKRRIAPEAIQEIRDDIRMDTDRPQMLVGVFVGSTAKDIADAARVGTLDAVQLSGDEDPAILADIDLPVIKALRFEAGIALSDAYRQMDAWYAAPRPATRVIVEGHRAGSYGGTGTLADWDFVAALAARYPIILAGGLTLDNVAEAIDTVRPAGVDVSSGTETDGVKDPAKIRAFIRNARAAEEQATLLEE
jgi:phosphoribosylanthranilate isomerase